MTHPRWPSTYLPAYWQCPACRLSRYCCPRCRLASSAAGCTGSSPAQWPRCAVESVRVSLLSCVLALTASSVRPDSLAAMRDHFVPTSRTCGQIGGYAVARPDAAADAFPCGLPSRPLASLSLSARGPLSPKLTMLRIVPSSCLVQPILGCDLSDRRRFASGSAAPAALDCPPQLGPPRLVPPPPSRASEPSRPPLPR